MMRSCHTIVKLITRFKAGEMPMDVEPLEDLQGVLRLLHQLGVQTHGLNLFNNEKMLERWLMRQSAIKKHTSLVEQAFKFFWKHKNAHQTEGKWFWQLATELLVSDKKLKAGHDAARPIVVVTDGKKFPHGTIVDGPIIRHADSIFASDYEPLPAAGGDESCAEAAEEEDEERDARRQDAAAAHEDARLDEDEAESRRDTPRSADDEAAIAAGDAE